MQNVFNLAAYGGEEVLDLVLLGAVHDTRLQVVNEVAVALVGGHTPGRGVGLGQVALTLEGDHLRAHRGGRDVEVGAVGDRRGADGLSGVDVLGDDRLEDRGLARVEGGRARTGRHGASGQGSSFLAVDSTEC